MKKLLLALLLVAAMVITFAACNDNPAGGTTDGNGTTDAPEETEAPKTEPMHPVSDTTSKFANLRFGPNYDPTNR